MVKAILPIGLPTRNFNSISVDDISSIYEIRVLSDSTIIFTYLTLPKTFANESKRYFEGSNNADDTLSLLMKNIGDVLG